MGKIYILNRNDFLELDPEFLKGKAIIRVHSHGDKDWHDKEKYENMLQLYFEDLLKMNLGFFEKFWGKHPFFDFESVSRNFRDPPIDIPFNIEQAREVVNFAKKHKKRDFVVSCEFGKSRSVAIGLFLEDFLPGKIQNKDERDFKFANDWVLYLLNKAS